MHLQMESQNDVTALKDGDWSEYCISGDINNCLCFSANCDLCKHMPHRHIRVFFNFITVGDSHVTRNQASWPNSSF